MDLLNSEFDIAPVPQVAHTGTHLEDHCRNALDEEGAFIVLVGGTRNDRHQTFGRILDLADYNALQFKSDSLLGDRREHTQNSLRKIFDSGAEERALLFIDSLDALLTWSHVDDTTGLPDDAMPSIVEYFFQRIESYPYPVLLGVEDILHLNTARKAGAHLVVSH